MNSFMLALSVVLPLVVYMTVGGLIRRFSIFSKENFKTLNGLIFKIFIPLTLFMNVYRADLGDALKPDVFLLVLVQVILCRFILCTKGDKREKRFPDGDPGNFQKQLCPVRNDDCRFPVRK